MKYKALFAFWQSMHPQRRAYFLWLVLTALLNLFDLSTYTFRFVGGYKMAMLLPSILGLVYLLYWDKWRHNLSLKAPIYEETNWRWIVFLYVILAIFCWNNWLKYDPQLKIYYQQIWADGLDFEGNQERHQRELIEASLKREAIIKIVYLDVLLFPFLGLILGPLIRFWYRPKPQAKPKHKAKPKKLK